MTGWCDMNTMQVCIYSYIKENHWCRELFPNWHPLELPLAGKSIWAHLLGFCTLLKAIGVSDILVSDCEDRDEMMRRLGDGNYWSLNFEYQRGGRFSSLGQLLEFYKESFKADDVMIVFGDVLPVVNDRSELLDKLTPIEDPMLAQDDGIYLYVNECLFKWECPLYKIDTLKNFFDANLRMLSQPGLHVLPGYSLKKEYSIGRNVRIRSGCEIEAPVVLGDNVCLERGVTAHNGVVVGADVMIDEKTELSHSVIFDHSYIGRSLSIRNKIVSGKRIIDPELNAFVDLDDAFLAGDFR